jgi:hypothetical protein
MSNFSEKWKGIKKKLTEVLPNVDSSRYRTVLADIMIPILIPGIVIGITETISVSV